MKNVKVRTPQARLTTLLALHSRTRAELIRNCLRDHGIRAKISGEFQAGFTGTLPIEIIVRDADKERAAELITKHFPEG